ncbi:MAG TPA: alpha-hydroxy acid oxidase, partial [Candidatus Krumholzibacteria bacterium]|nr:alpha-hydroxy acid oxidase [Candidatus Krumholzibacteria bacterium]
AERDTTTSVLGEKVSMPVLIAPTAFHRLAHADGELATARAAGKAGTIMIVSTLSNTAVEDIAATATGPLWFQLYIYKDRDATRDLVARVEAAGCSAIVLTVDAPILGPRERDVRNRFALPQGLSVQNLVAAGQGTVAGQESGSGLATYVSSFIDPSISWRDVEWLRSITRLPVIIKGIVRADDARRAVEAGASGIVVSNHGGRQLDALPATIDALPYVAVAVDNRAEVYVDGGIRRGLDVVKAMALGARAVLIGRPVLWGLAADGEHGVARVLDMLQREIDNTMGLCGCPRVESITADLLRPDSGR